ncbi:MAG: helix-turn-helix domain-containing protein [Planctomycetota bacterium]|jgi:hypothetical protein
MAKMFYTLEEVTDKLQLTEEQLKELVRTGKLREFRDAGKVNYKTEEVDALAAASAGSASASGELVLEPAEDSGAEGAEFDLASPSGLGSDVLTLEDADLEDTSAGTKAEGEKKDDTVVTSVGVNVFDDDDLEEVDPLAQTVVTEGAAGLGIEGVGSGSGLLDLTRESDDTSLGADLLDEIYPEDQSPVEMGEDTRAGLEEAITETPEEEGAAEEIFEAEPVEAAVGVVRTRTVVEYGPDAVSTGLTGMIVVATAVMCVAGLGAAAIMQDVWPALLEAIYQNMWIFGTASVVLAGIAMGIGFFLGKRSEG